MPRQGEYPDLNGDMQAHFPFGIKRSAGAPLMMELGSAALMCRVGCAGASLLLTLLILTHLREFGPWDRAEIHAPSPPSPAQGRGWHMGYKLNDQLIAEYWLVN